MGNAQAERLSSDVRLAACELTSFPHCDINRFSPIEFLILDQNELFELSLPENKVFCTLRTLSVSGNQLESFPSGLTQCKNLSSIDVSQNNIHTISESIWLDLPNIRTLCLQENNIQTLPIVSSTHSKIQIIACHTNQLVSVPKSLHLLENLRELYLDHNQLEEIPNELSWLTKLQTLDVSYNHLTDIPSSIFQIESLRSLYLQNNQIQTIYDCSKMIHLQYFNFSNNLITTVHSSVSKLPSLRKIQCYNNVSPLFKEQSFLNDNVPCKREPKEPKNRSSKFGTHDKSYTV